MLDAQWQRAMRHIGAGSKFILVFQSWEIIKFENGDAKIPSAEAWRYACFCYWVGVYRDVSIHIFERRFKGLKEDNVFCLWGV